MGASDLYSDMKLHMALITMVHVQYKLKIIVTLVCWKQYRE